MPRTRLRISITETKEFRARLLRLDRIGIATGDAENLSSKPDRLILEQIDPGFARVYDLPNGDVAVVVLARLTVLAPGVMIIDRQMTKAWDEWVFDLSDPRQYPFFQDLIRGLPQYPPIVLNDWLAGRVLPLGLCQREGVIIATDQSPVPANYPDETLVPMELSVRDEQGNETSCEFTGRVDRSLRHKYERQQQERRLATPLGEREGLYGTKVRPSDETTISPKPNVDSERHATGDYQPSRPGRSIPAAKEIYRSKIQ